MKRIKIVRDKPNRLFETWLEEWKNEAIHRKSDLWKHFAKALDSLKRYPLPLESGRDCIILQHFGTKLCSMLDRKLEEYRKQESNNAVNCIAVVSNDENYTKKTSTEENQITSETQEKAIIIKQASNKKKNITEKLVNVNEIVSKHTDRQICFEPDIFDIILLVDTQETSGGKTKFQYDATLVELTQLGVSFEVRRLKVGDFAWIAKCKKTNDELVIPYIVERKRIDDLSASITDGRFHEQKFRLKQSGIENLMYIVENVDKSTRFSIPLQSLLQASVNCLVQDNFTVKYTRNHKDSILYLSYVTKTLIKIYKDKRLFGCKKEQLIQTNYINGTINLMEFKEFNKSSSKQRTFKVSEMFIRQLLQLKGMSVDKVMAIVKHYATPEVLIASLQSCDENGEQLLASIQVGDKKRQLGHVISKTIYQLYMTNELS
ncbi:crossover junction endonuclease MUS81 isoform X1 [Harpegnathos saltator]|uniref:Crossover junction endonuclease MUS81 n=1 Tax=Harpegnathos saltator TaxID=610380 RepID=E2B3N3_HARSA|nr:crossover junction endonuclease MUS81 isoform X1 [Harpegnathos saltator]EFN89689.1 Crossover junction endonuclease MUS81 [Harpegnathos saltator]